MYNCMICHHFLVMPKNLKDTTDAFQYTSRQNLMRLQKCLIGAVREVVASLLIYPYDVDSAMGELRFRF